MAFLDTPSRKLITQIALTRFGLKRFEAKINKALEEGYSISSFEISRGLFRTTCYAILSKGTLDAFGRST